jgi:RNA polymerase sigma-70 factor (ECF subfamily)
LARLLAELMPDQPEVLGLLAMLLLLEARRATRVDATGALVLLPDQDRSRWDRALIDEGHALVRACLRRGHPGPYQFQAAINAVHTDAARAEDTDWRQILALYDQWMAVAPTPVVALNRAVAVAELAGPEAALRVVDNLDLTTYQPYWVTRAELLARAERPAEAREAYDRALALTDNAVEHAHLTLRRALV